MFVLLEGTPVVCSYQGRGWSVPLTGDPRGCNSRYGLQEGGKGSAMGIRAYLHFDIFVREFIDTLKRFKQMYTWGRWRCDYAKLEMSLGRVRYGPSLGLKSPIRRPNRSSERELEDMEDNALVDFLHSVKSEGGVSSENA